MTYITTVTEKGQITVPKAVRDKLGIKPRQKVGLVEVGGQYQIKPILNLESLMGSLKPDKKFDKKKAREAYLPLVLAGKI